jgi:hypothetical protein
MMIGCESGGGDSDTPAEGDWTPYAGQWYGSGFREVWVDVSATDGAVSVRDNVNPDTQTVPWNTSHRFEIAGGPTCLVTFNSPTSATVAYTTHVYNMTKISSP